MESQPQDRGDTEQTQRRQTQRTPYPKQHKEDKRSPKVLRPLKSENMFLFSQKGRKKGEPAHALILNDLRKWLSPGVDFGALVIIGSWLSQQP